VTCSRFVVVVPDSTLLESITKSNSENSPYDVIILPGGLKGAQAFTEVSNKTSLGR